MSPNSPSSAMAAMRVERQDLDGDVLTLVGEPSAGARAVGSPVGREEEVDALGRHGRHGPAFPHGLERAQDHAAFLERLAGHTGGGIAPFEPPRRRFQHRRHVGGQERRGPELAHQQGLAALGIVGQHRHRDPVVLDLALDLAPIAEAEARDEKAPPALVDGANRKDARRV